MINIALVNPPLSGHKLRGTGTYAEELYKALKKLEELEISLVNYGSNLSTFNAVHYPYFDPFFLTLPIVKWKPAIVTVHDLIPLTFSKHFPRGVKGEIKWLIQKLSLRSVKAIITDSFASADAIAKLTDCDTEKINVIYLGVRSEFKIIKSADILQKIREKYKLPEKFLLHVGDVNYNKNIPGIIKAFDALNRKHGDLHLVLVGNGFVENSPQLSQIINLITQLGLKDKVKRLGYIGLEELAAVYNLAQVYLQLSYAEGFGLPVLEAMACGCPTVVANASSLVEITGDAAVLVNPYNMDDMIANISAVLDNKVQRQEMIEKGLGKVKEFTWEKCAQETLEVYRKVLA